MEPKEWVNVSHCQNQEVVEALLSAMVSHYQSMEEYYHQSRTSPKMEQNKGTKTVRKLPKSMQLKQKRSAEIYHD